MKITKTKEQLIDMYLHCLKENEIPWNKGWQTTINHNGITKSQYKGINSLILNYVSYLEKYTDPRWYTFLQIKNKGWKLSNKAKGKGVPIEFWSYYNFKLKKRMDFLEYNNYIEKHPNEIKDFKIFVNCSYVYNAKYVEDVPEYINNANQKIHIPKYITNVIKNLGVKYEEFGNQAYYDVLKDKIVLPPSEKFLDKYSYYATQLHELCHSTGSKDRLNRNFDNNSKEEYAREELVAEIGSSFIMQKLNIPTSTEHYDNHKSYIKSWIKILENNPQELFSAVAKANKVCDYIEQNSKVRKKDLER